jgi:hypothetical protein
MPRRTFLKGLGVSVALPWLEVMSVNAKIHHHRRLDGDRSEIPRRAMFTYWGLGVEITRLHAAGHGKNYTLTPSLRRSRRSRTTAP